MSDSIQNLTDTDIDDYINNMENPLVIDFWAPWCAPCLAMDGIIKKLSKKFNGKVNVAKVDVEKYQEIMNRFSIRGIPAILLFKDKKEISRIVGSHSLGDIESWLAKENISNVSKKAIKKMELLPWGSFYGDNDLFSFFKERLKLHAESGELIVSSSSYWFNGKGTLSACMTHQADIVTASYMTGLPASFLILLEKCSCIKIEQLTTMLQFLTEGKDYHLIPIDFIRWWLSVDFFEWDLNLKDKNLINLLNKWNDNYDRVKDDLIENFNIDDDFQKETYDLIQSYEKSDFILEKIVATILFNISQFPLSSDYLKWDVIFRNVTWARFQIIQIKSGWSFLERSIPDIRMQWFQDKEKESITGRLSDEDIDLLRKQWSFENKEFIEKEKKFHSNLEILSDPLFLCMGNKINELIKDSPEI